MTLQLQARMKANMGPAFDRVIFYPRLPNSDTFMSFISVVDVLLHPFPFDGSKTAADGLAMGIPVVTWPSVGGWREWSLPSPCPSICCHAPCHRSRDSAWFGMGWTYRTSSAAAWAPASTTPWGF